MSEHQSKLAPGEIQFHQWCEPPLEPGNWAIEIEQKVTELAAEGQTPRKFDNTDAPFPFSVAGPRFSLDPSEIYSVYPPKGHIGDFANALPHVVFSRRTLPWERSVVPGPRKEGDSAPWMALLVFNAADFDSKEFPDIIKSRAVGELINPDKSADYHGPKLAINNAEDGGLAEYESINDLCNTVDIPWDLFQKVAPSAKDIGYLAHVREVNTGAKETLSYLADGWFSVALANRFPEPEKKETEPPRAVENRALLVSLEGMKDFLPGAEKASANKPVRLAVLANWSFHCREAFNFKWLMNKMVVRRLCIPLSVFTPDDFNDIDALAAELLASKTSISKYLWDRVSPESRQVLESHAATAAEKHAALIDELNDLIEGESIYQENRFAGVKLTDETKSLIEQTLHGAELTRFNRLLLEQALPKRVKKSEIRDELPSREAERGSGADDQVRYAFQRGYSALNHGTRLGEKSVSWYRGPLVPFDLGKESQYTFLPAPDAAMRYNPLDGMMDVTYAAAFQLGRLLGLQDRHFATALHAYRGSVRRQTNSALQKAPIGAQLGSKHADESDIMISYLKILKVGSASGQLEGDAGWAAIQRTSEKEERRLVADIDLTIPESVTDWLARTTLLYRIPFSYLVADERMLPPDSIRFFFLDPGWLNCLLQGACSVGRSTSRDELVDEHLRDKSLAFSLNKSLEIRAGKAGKDGDGSIQIMSNSANNPSTVTTAVPHGLKSNDKVFIWGVSSSSETTNISGEHEIRVVDETHFEVPVDASDHAGTGGWFVPVPKWPLTGFLIRSSVVEGWQGLEMRAWADSEEEDSLQPLRIDRLAPDIMLCIFNGKVDRIEVKQPPEGMHFGASPTDDGYARFHLRSLSDAGQLSDDTRTKITPTDNTLRSNGKRVINVDKLADKLKKKLGADGAFTSAEFGVEMVESPGRVVFDVKEHIINTDKKEKTS
jgi:hypothetical protein